LDLDFEIIFLILIRIYWKTILGPVENPEGCVQEMKGKGGEGQNFDSDFFNSK
jgi:hypothetical protein